MYQVIARRKHMLPIMINRADAWLLREIGNAVIGYAVPVMPDGLIVSQTETEQDARFYETWRGQLVSITMEQIGEVVTTKQATPTPEVTYREIQEEIKIAAAMIHTMTTHNWNDHVDGCRECGDGREG